MLTKQLFMFMTGRCKCIYLVAILYVQIPNVYGQTHQVLDQVNVFLGSSGDHGQLSPAACSPHSLLSIGPQTYPTTHTGYEFKAKKTLGFTHNRVEGAGCKGSGGLILIKPLLNGDSKSFLIKKDETAKPGNYKATYTNGLVADIAVFGNEGVHRYTFPKNTSKEIYIDLRHSINRSFLDEKHEIIGQTITGWIDAKTVCNRGKYRTYYTIQIKDPISWSEEKGKLIGKVQSTNQVVDLHIKLSPVAESYTKKALHNYDAIKQMSAEEWNSLLGRIKVEGNIEKQKLFYSLLYRSLQTPYRISEADGKFKTISGAPRQAKDERYNGWAIWDNFKTQLPLLSLFYSDYYQSVVNSIADMYPFGKKDFSTMNEPSNTIRTEHGMVVLLDAYRKGYSVNFPFILDSLMAEADRLDYKTPDKALEAAYDTWALSQIGREINNKQVYEKYASKTKTYSENWNLNFKDVKVKDVDVMGARKMYQGTIWQYRWSVPFDVEGMKNLIGGEKQFIKELDQFFEGDFFNRANQPDIQAPLLYNATSEPWKAQKWIHTFANDSVNNYYFNDNSKGVYADIRPVFTNTPNGLIRTMDNDAGCMSSWYVWTAVGLSPALVGEPIYYFNAPLFSKIEYDFPGGKKLRIHVENYNPRHAYIKSIKINGLSYNSNWITHKMLMDGADIKIVTSAVPNKNWGLLQPWISSLK